VAEPITRSSEISYTESPVTPSDRTTAAVKAPPRRARVIKNVLAGWGGYLISAVIAMFLSPFVVHRLGDTLYGVWTLIVSLTGYLGLLDMGVRGAVTRYVARYHAQGKHDEASRTASTAIVLFAIGGAIAILISFTLAGFALDRLHIPPEMHFAARVVAVLAGITVASSLTGGVFGGIVVGLQRVDLTNLVETSSSLLRAASIVLALRWGQGIITLALIQLAFSLLAGFANLLIGFRLYPELSLGLHKVSRPYFRDILSFGVYSFLLHIFAYLILYTDAIVIAAFLPIGMVTFFAIAGNLVTYARQMVGAITTSLTPRASQLDASGHQRELQTETITWTRYATSIITAIGITFVIRGKTFIGLWMGPSYADLSGLVLSVLTIGMVLGMASCVPWSVTFGLGKHKSLVPLYLVESLANLGLSIALVRSMGLVGVAWGTTIPELVFSATFWPWFMSKTLQIPVTQFIRSAWMRPLVALIPFAICTYLIERGWPARNVLEFFLQVGVALVAAFIGCWFGCVSKADREALGKTIRAFAAAQA
jgi:O-antigen/teichoic acid export membrane protein